MNGGGGSVSVTDPKNRGRGKDAGLSGTLVPKFPAAQLMS